MGAHHAREDRSVDRGPVPGAVLASFWLWLVVSALNAVVVVDAGRLGYWDVVALLGGLLVLQLAATVRMLVGRNWARVVLLMMGAQQFAAGLRDFGRGHPILTGPVLLALLLAAGVLLLVPVSKRYFGDPSRPLHHGPRYGRPGRDAAPDHHDPV